jgi:hypothetical protein
MIRPVETNDTEGRGRERHVARCIHGHSWLSEAHEAHFCARSTLAEALCFVCFVLAGQNECDSLCFVALRRLCFVLRFRTAEAHCASVCLIARPSRGSRFRTAETAEAWHFCPPGSERGCSAAAGSFRAAPVIQSGLHAEGAALACFPVVPGAEWRQSARCRPPHVKRRMPGNRQAAHLLATRSEPPVTQHSDWMKGFLLTI